MTPGFGSSLLSIKHYPICLVAFSSSCVPWGLISWATHAGALTAGASGASCIYTTLHLGNSSCSHCALTQAYQGERLQRMCQVYPKSNSHLCSYFLLASAGYQQISASYQRGEDGQMLKPRKCLSDNFSGEPQHRKSSLQSRLNYC